MKRALCLPDRPLRAFTECRLQVVFHVKHTHEQNGSRAIRYRVAGYHESSFRIVSFGRDE